MRDLIDQIINILSDIAANMRQQHPLYQAIAEAIHDSPDDTADLANFARDPDRHESVLRDLLKQRLPQDNALVTKLHTLIATPQVESDPLHQRSVGDTTSISGNTNIGVVGHDIGSVNIEKQTFAAAIQVFFGEHSDTDEQDQAVLARYLNNLIDRFSLASQPDPAAKDQQYSPIAPESLRTIYLTMASEIWLRAEESGAQPEVSSAEALPDKARRLAQPNGHTETKDTDADDAPEAALELQQPYLLTKAISDSRKIVILGRPGSGKTTFLRYLAVALAQAGQAASGTPPDLPGWKAPLLIPFYASLAGFAAKLRENTRQPSSNDLWRYLVSGGDSDLWRGLSEPLANSFSAGNLLLVLDGLEEISNPLVRADVADAIVDLAAKSKSFVVVTCRDQAFDEQVQKIFQKWGSPVRIAKLTLGQVRYFVHEWYRGVAANHGLKSGDAEEHANDLLSQLNEWPNWQDLVQGPKFLDYICTLHFTKRWVPENRAALYRDNMQNVLERWQKRPQPDQPKSLLAQLKEDHTLGNLTVEHLRRSLAALAYRARKNALLVGQRGLIERGIVREEFLTLFTQFGLDIGQAAQKSQYVLEFLESDELLVQVREGLYQLSDYESYLAACYLIDQRGQRPDTLVLAYTNWRENPAKWREIIFITLQQLLLDEDYDTIAKWIQLLVAEEHGTRPRSKHERTLATLFAAECLEKFGVKPAPQGVKTKDAPKPWSGLEQMLPDVTTMSLRELWMDLTQALVDIVSSESAKAAERVQAGVYLCKLADPRPGVCTALPDLVEIDGDSFVPGTSPDEVIELHDANEIWIGQQIEQRNLRLNFPPDWASDQLNDRPMQVSAFALARYSITNAQYALFVEKGYDPQQPWWDDAGRAWLERDDSSITDESDPVFARYRRRKSKRQPEYWDHPLLGQRQPNFPVVGICWYEAQAYCRWLSQKSEINRRGQIYRLPSEAEWEFAARGTERRRFPWGQPEPDAEIANFFKKFDGTTSVGCFPGGATPTGIYDMAGNVYEWTGSIYRTYPYDPNDDFDQTASPVEQGLIMRGGGWRDPLGALFAAARNNFIFINRGAPPDCYFDKLGFRIAKTIH